MCGVGIDVPCVVLVDVAVWMFMCGICMLGCQRVCSMMVWVSVVISVSTFGCNLT